jgi:hypothetical protein
MRRVVDSNALQSEQLRDYLAADARNLAVLTNDASIEAYKGNTLASIFKSMEILSGFPDQVIVLKGTQALCGLHGTGKGLQKRLIDYGTTRDFGKWCKELLKARAGDGRFIQQILKLGRDATDHANRTLAAVPEIVAGRAQVAEVYTGSELRAIRTGTAVSSALKVKFVQQVLLMAGMLLRDHPNVREWPHEFEALVDRYLFRYALCTHLWVLDWISDGSPSQQKSERVRNDLVDLHFATCSTYFDGPMSSDRKVKRVYEQAMRALDSMMR